MPTAIILACCQVVCVTSQILSEATFNMKPIDLLGNYVINIVVTQPLNCFCFILWSISVEDIFQSSSKKWHYSITRSVWMLILLGFDIFSLTYLPNGWDVFLSGWFCYVYAVFFILYIHRKTTRP